MKGMGSHQRAIGETNEWLTPPYILQALGEFDLDPCSPVNRPWDTARNHLTIIDNGLIHDWYGRVWVNPPYGKGTGRWLEKLSEHKNGLALIFGRTETQMFHDFVWNRAFAILFLKGRLQFYKPDGTKPNTSNAGAPSVLIAYDEPNTRSLAESLIPGKLIII